jgi:uncharacterized protein YegP (UPF0339 family)
MLPAPRAAGTARGAENGEDTLPGKFVVKKGTTGKFRFSLVSSNGQIVATSEAYNSKASCMNGIKAVRNLATEASLEDQTTKEWAAGEEARKAAAATKKAKKSGARKSAAKKAAATT